MSLKNKLLTIIGVLLLTSCANIVAPTGGPKDTTPPSLIACSPKDSTLNFKSEKITLAFSENIGLNEPQKNITISPPLPNDFSVESQQNKLLLKLKNLQPNTTYTIIADNAILDITEGNTLKSVKYLFSTGNALDSSKVFGSVVSSTTLEPSKNSTVCLYTILNDSVIINNRPNYITQTDNNGNFIIEHIKPATYKIVVIADKNNNNRWEAGEEIGYLDEPIMVDSIPKRLLIRQFNQRVPNHHLIAATSTSKGIYAFEFDRGNYDEKGDFRRIWINQEDPSTDKKERYSNYTIGDECWSETYKTYLITDLHPKDSAHFNYSIDDTLYKTVVKVATKPTFEPLQYYYTHLEDSSLSIMFYRALDTNTVDLKKIRLYDDTSEIKAFSLDFHDFLGVIINHIKKGQYRLVFSKGAITDIFGVNNDSFQIKISVLNKDDLQSITLKTDTLRDTNYQLRLVMDPGFCNTVSLESNSTYRFQNLFPGKYKIIVFKNPRKFERFILGDYFHHIQPEKIVYYKEIDLKTGFDIEELIRLLPLK